MPIKLKKGKTASVSAADLLQAFQADYGEEVGDFGGAFVNADRIPTGMFPLDLALAGGFPRGRCSIIYGPESSAKTSTALLAVAHHQKLWPKLTCAFFDVENSFDPAWAKLLGVDTTQLIVIRPDYGEQLVDMVEAILLAEDCGLARTRAIAIEVMGLVAGYSPSAIVLEGYSLNMRHASSVVPLVELGGIVRLMLHIDGLAWFDPRASELKKFVTGKGTADKAQMMMQVLKRWGHTSMTHNTADAYGLACMGLARMNALHGATQSMRAIAGAMAQKTT